MADTIFQAVHNWFRAKNQEAAEALSDPVRDGKLAITDSEKQIAEFTSKIAGLIAETKNIERQLADAKSDVAKFQNVAVSALQANNEADARDAVALKQKAQQQVDTFQAQLTANNNLVTKLRDQLNTARLKVANAKSNIAQLQARSSAAKIRTDLAKASAQFNNQGGLAALDNLETAVNKQENEAEAYEELADSASGAPGQKLIEKYSSGDASVDEELQRMKAAISSGSSTTPLSLPHQSGSA